MSSTRNPITVEVVSSSEPDVVQPPPRRIGSRRGYSSAPGFDEEEGQVVSDYEARRSARANRRRDYQSPYPEDVQLFIERQNIAAGRCKQLGTLSTIIIVVQIGLMAYMIQVYGFAPTNENPMYGPSAQVLVDYGAKQAGLILYRHEWWRLVTPIFLHAGIIHIAMNVYLQWQLGGFLNIMYGTIKWTAIYFLSGVYGNILSCIADPDTVGVGSSGALMGVLGSFVVFIICTWNKVPDEAKSARNCNLLSVLVAIGMTMALSYVSFIDGAAHGGGLLAGFLLALLLLTNELDNACTKWGLRAIASIALVVMYAYSLDYLYTKVHPSREVMDEATNR